MNDSPTKCECCGAKIDANSGPLCSECQAELGSVNDDSPEVGELQSVPKHASKELTKRYRNFALLCVAGGILIGYLALLKMYGLERLAFIASRDIYYFLGMIVGAPILPALFGLLFGIVVGPTVIGDGSSKDE